MHIQDEILVNQYGQYLIDIKPLQERFSLIDSSEKRLYLKDLVNLIIQSKALDEDIAEAIKLSGLKSTYTPCVMIRKGVKIHILENIINLPDGELNKVLALFLSIFRIAYQRRYLLEKNTPSKWWYWDMSDKTNMEKIDKMKLI